jgi:flagellar secretion chaperone FliS
MTNSAHNRYLEAEVLGADPLKLIRLLYRGAIDAVRTARRRLAEGDIRERAREINRAWGILQELAGSLDHTQGGEISRRLGGLYAYMQMRLVEGNANQSEGPLKEVEDLLTTLSEAWQAANLDNTPAKSANGFEGLALISG